MNRTDLKHLAPVFLDQETAEKYGLREGWYQRIVKLEYVPISKDTLDEWVEFSGPKVPAVRVIEMG
jgi:hypothetical protein